MFNKREIIETALKGRVMRHDAAYFVEEQIPHMIECHECALYQLGLRDHPCDGWRMYTTRPQYGEPETPRLWETWEWVVSEGWQEHGLVFVAKACSSFWIELVSPDGKCGRVVHHSCSDCE